ncbi:Replication initiation and membrane attachment [Caloramator mitchellensis]|uniref:Replication initiation and membrane attachment n=1 Tax=Caloramator mitchellensis TaxID=908809 RepID=A0A0R3JS26_CALMK|nr:DnaD domain protein [Caloramator mitchellensis]KRQ86310.1 Replication initiation and membrane attachment [Caloramator mitchellensis]
MPNIKLNSPMLDYIPLPYEFLEKNLKEIDGNFLKVYILLLKFAFDGIDTSTSNISNFLGIIETDVIRAIEYLQENQVLAINKDGSISFSYSRRNNLELTKQSVLKDIERLLSRPLSTKEITTFLSFIDEFKFTPEVVNLLVEYCVSKQKTDIRYIERVAISWHDNDVKTIDDAQKFLKSFEEKWAKYRDILNFMGIKDMEISKPQEELLEKWIYKYQLSDDVIKEACRICVKRINEINFSYIDAVLNDWHKNKIDSIDKVKKYDRKQKTTPKQTQNYFNSYGGQRKYDIKELERDLLGRGDDVEK